MDNTSSFLGDYTKHVPLKLLKKLHSNKLPNFAKVPPSHLIGTLGTFPKPYSERMRISTFTVVFICNVDEKKTITRVNGERLWATNYKRQRLPGPYFTRI